MEVYGGRQTRWKSHASGSHRGQTILLSARSTSTKAPTHVLSLLSYRWRYLAISGTTKVLRFHSR